MTASARRINALARALSAQTYLEIGVNKADTFREVAIAERTAVDTVFRFETGPLRNENTRFIEVESDRYFAERKERGTFDVIFIDGLHVFEQVVRDFSNAVINSHSQTVILVDDTKPSDVYSRLRDIRDTLRFRHNVGSEIRAWHGDVYKYVIYLHDFWPGSKLQNNH